MRCSALFLGLVLLLGGCRSGGAPFAPAWELPARPALAMPADSLISRWLDLDRVAREELAVQEILAGNVPSWLRNVQTIAFDADLDGRTVHVEIGLLPDYLTVGSDQDFLWMPLSPQAAQRIADATGMLLPTPFLVDAIWRGATWKVAPRPIPPADSMTTLSVFVTHRDKLLAQRDSLGLPPGAWTAGHKKDVVISKVLEGLDDRVAIYGWHRENGLPIQPVYAGHGSNWVDYSHGIRLVSREVRVDGAEYDLATLLTDSLWYSLFNPAGPLARADYPVR